MIPSMAAWSNGVLFVFLGNVSVWINFGSLPPMKRLPSNESSPPSSESGSGDVQLIRQVRV